MRIASISVLVALIFLWGGTKVYAAGVGFASSDAAELTNSYQDLVTLTITVPQKGYIVLTGSGTLSLFGPASSSAPIYGWANISIGTVSGASNNGNETAVEIPSAPGGGVETTQPFSITTVIPVKKGVNNFYMVGIRDPNTTMATWYANFLKLTAIFIQKGM